MAPTLAADPAKAYLMRPVLAQPPLCNLAELKTVLTLDDLADMHEALNVRELASQIAKRDAGKNKR